MPPVASAFGRVSLLMQRRKLEAGRCHLCPGCHHSDSKARGQHSRRFISLLQWSMGTNARSSFTWQSANDIMSAMFRKLRLAVNVRVGAHMQRLQMSPLLQATALSTEQDIERIHSTISSRSTHQQEQSKCCGVQAVHRNNAKVSLGGQRLTMGSVLATASQECQQHAAEEHQDQVLQTFAAVGQLLRRTLTLSALLAAASCHRPTATRPTSRRPL